MKFQLGKKFEIYYLSEPTLYIEITKIGPKEIEFLATGNAVENPEVPRVMPPGALAKFLSKCKARIAPRRVSEL